MRYVAHLQAIRQLICKLLPLNFVVVYPRLDRCSWILGTWDTICERYT